MGSGCCCGSCMACRCSEMTAVMNEWRMSTALPDILLLL